MTTEKPDPPTPASRASPSSARDLGSFKIRRQPNDETCGPTCLHAVYRHYGDRLGLDDLVPQVPMLESGGTLGVLLATHAQRRGYRTKVITWNLQVFDPTWFGPAAPDLRERLVRTSKFRSGARGAVAARAYIEYLDAGGELSFEDLDTNLLSSYLGRGVPVLTGLSATFLYREPRERPADNQPDDIRGESTGHFVVLTGYDAEKGEALVSDPLHPNPMAEQHTYPVSISRLIGAIYLGVLTYDANLVVIEPPPSSEQEAGCARSSS